MVENFHSSNKGIIHLDCLPNFRAVEEYTCVDGTRKLKRGVIFRSSRPDNLTSEECQRFDKIGIRCIIDLRRPGEYLQANGEKLLDETYQTLRWVDNKQHYVLFQNEKKKVQQAIDVSQFSTKRKLLITYFSMSLIWHVLMKIHFMIRYLSLLIALFDYIFKTHFFVKLVAKIYVNKQNLSTFYYDALKFTTGPILQSLRVVSDKKNLPVMINCSQGKDRTGILVMLLLACAGVSDKDIVHDYSKSEDGLISIRDNSVREICGKYGFKEEFTRGRAETMVQTLQLIRDNHGSIYNYLDSIGFTESDRTNLAQLITEPL